VIAALAIAQDEYGWLSTEAMDASRAISIATVAVYEVARSTRCSTSSRPAVKLTICTNLPCALQGATAAAAHLKRKLGIDFNETSADGLFTVEAGRMLRRLRRCAGRARQQTSGWSVGCTPTSSMRVSASCREVATAK
jgi:NADH-quinone oxidoreductase subunit E